MTNAQSNWRLGLTLSLTTAIFWGLLPFALKELLTVLDSITITWYRFAAAAVIASLWYGRGSITPIKRLLSGRLRWLTIMTVCCLVSNYVLFVFGLSYISPAAAELIIQLAPLLLLLASVFIFKEVFSVRQWFGVLLVVLGLLLFFHHRLRELVPSDDTFWWGGLMIVLAAITWAAFGVGQKIILRQEQSRDLLLLIYLAGTLIYAPFSSPTTVIAFTPTLWAILAFAALNTIIAYGSFGAAMSCWEASRVSAVTTLAPLFTLLFGVLMNLFWPGSVVVEPMDILSWLGGGLVVLGSIMAALSER